MRIGFTGTQRGMTDLQAERVTELLQALTASEAHHGLCIGADAGFHAICRWLGIPMHGHPPIKGTKVMEVDPVEFHAMFPRKDYLSRNHDIVDHTQALIAAPASGREEMRSGTWATVRYARKGIGKAIYVVTPDGELLDGRFMVRKHAS